MTIVLFPRNKNPSANPIVIMSAKSRQRWKTAIRAWTVYQEFVLYDHPIFLLLLSIQNSLQVKIKSGERKLI